MCLPDWLTVWSVIVLFVCLSVPISACLDMCLSDRSMHLQTRMAAYTSNSFDCLEVCQPHCEWVFPSGCSTAVCFTWLKNLICMCGSMSVCRAVHCGFLIYLCFYSILSVCLMRSSVWTWVCWSLCVYVSIYWSVYLSDCKSARVCLSTFLCRNLPGETEK